MFDENNSSLYFAAFQTKVIVKEESRLVNDSFITGTKSIVRKIGSNYLIEPIFLGNTTFNITVS